MNRPAHPYAREPRPKQGVRRTIFHAFIYISFSEHIRDFSYLSNGLGGNTARETKTAHRISVRSLIIAFLLARNTYLTESELNYGPHYQFNRGTDRVLR